MRFTFFIALALSLVLFVGCTGTENPYGAVHVEGTVTVDGAAIPGINVNFVPRDGEHAAGGQTDANGKFTVSTGGFNGAKPGTYDVVFSKVEIPGQDLSMEEYNARFGGRQPEPVHIIPQKFESPSTSGIEPVTVDTDRRKNVFTFDLRTQ